MFNNKLLWIIHLINNLPYVIYDISYSTHRVVFSPSQNKIMIILTLQNCKKIYFTFTLYDLMLAL